MTDPRDPPTLQDGVVELCRWRDEDIDVVMAAQHLDEQAARAWVQRQQARPLTVGVSRAIAPIGQSAVGYVGLIRRPRLELGAEQGGKDTELVFIAHHRVAGIGYWMAPDAQGQGMATRAVTLLARWALAQAGMTRVEALVDPRNQASCRVVEKSGFEREGYLRSYLVVEGQPTDAVIYSLLRRAL